MMKGFRVGDNVIARSKTDKTTVISGNVWSSDIDTLAITPTGHSFPHFCDESMYTFEKVEPSLEFGPGAVVKYDPRGTMFQRGSGNTWYVRGPSAVTPPNDADFIKDYLDNRLNVYFWGVGVTPPEGWVAP